MIAMFWNVRPVLRADAQIQEAIDNGSIDTLEKLNFELYEELNRLQPDLFEHLAMKDNSFMRNVRLKLADGQSGAKAEDNNKVKNALLHMWNWSPSLLHEPKSKRGTAHPECGYYLSPIIVDWNDPEGQFLECRKPPMIAKHWPRALYEDGIGNRAKPSVGLCEAKILLNTAKIILESPSAVLPSIRLRPGAPRRGRKGIGSKYELNQVTTGFIAYVAVVSIYFLNIALSAEEIFSDDGGSFNYVQFYTELCDYLEHPKHCGNQMT
ncbi:hypothetical protein FRC06_010845 [Ceratobasidium sp. 370]|nr:hypothetical protein FRC06_010845 [Ceratobasidium sp. 370]